MVAGVGHTVARFRRLALVVPGGVAGPEIAREKTLESLTGYLIEKSLSVRGGIRTYTPLFLVLVMIAITDVVFAVDSIPAIFAITDDPFIVMTSNIFAVLGLRALYFVLAGMADRFHLLSYGLALVLMFIGVKMLLIDYFKIPVFLALGVVAGLIVASIAASLIWRPRPLA